MNRFTALFAGVFMMLLISACVYFFWLQQMRILDQLCAQKDWFKCHAAVPSDISLYWPLGNKLALTPRLENYFSDLAGSKNSYPAFPPSLPAAIAIGKAAKLHENRFQFPHIAEAYTRCAVGIHRDCSRKALSELKLSVTDQATRKIIAVENLEALSLGLRDLSELYSKHQKFLIAEKAAKESIDVGTQAIAMASADPVVADRLHSEVLLGYAAHIKLLRMQKRDKEADQETLMLQP